MGIPIPGKDGLYIETGRPREQYVMVEGVKTKPIGIESAFLATHLWSTCCCFFSSAAFRSWLPRVPAHIRSGRPGFLSIGPARPARPARPGVVGRYMGYAIQHREMLYHAYFLGALALWPIFIPDVTKCYKVLIMSNTWELCGSVRRWHPSRHVGQSNSHKSPP